jgi:hypothetical protein
MIDLRPRVLLFIYQRGCAACEQSEPIYDQVLRARPYVMALRIDANGPFVDRVPVKIKATPTWLYRVGEQASLREGALTAEEVIGWIDSVERDLAVGGAS